jgi:hypothetical protein
VTKQTTGWEHLNSLIKVFYFRRTQRGGSKTAGRQIGSRIVPIALCFLRRAMWASGVPYEVMEEEVKARERLDNQDEPLGWASQLHEDHDEEDDDELESEPENDSSDDDE